MSQLPYPDHPRPDLQRAAWLNLNGGWRFAFDPGIIGEQERWHRPGLGPAKDLTITVPFPWESWLSGVAAPEYKGAAWYERDITVPEAWQGLRPFLQFGAVDWSARVWLNGRLVAEHENGYLPFACDLSPYLQPGETATLTVRAYDIADAATPVGKQVPRWYTNSSGIWQTVWLEGRSPDHLSSIRITPDTQKKIAEVSLSFYITNPGSFTVRLHSPDSAFPDLEQQHTFVPGMQQISLNLSVPAPRLWSPETPDLYQLQVELSPVDDVRVTDQVSTYFGMRSIERACWNGKPYEYILLNSEPVYLRGALDQAFHPDSLHSYPSATAIRDDIQLAKALGLNMLRCHIKINDPLYYYWADRLGLLIMYDLPSPDIDTPQMRRTMEATLRGAIARDFNHPSIFAWILFNETWGLENQHTREGQAWLSQMYRLARQLDPTRLVEDNSACRYDHVETDINSWHYYINNYHQVRQHIQHVVDETYPGSSFNFVGGAYLQDQQPLMNSEYAGISARMGDRDISWSFKYQTNELRRHDKICGYVYTELSDIEWEHNGFVNYDRSPKQFGYEAFVPDMTVADLNSPDYIGFDAPPCQTLPPGAEIELPIFTSNFGSSMRGGRAQWQLDFVDRFGQSKSIELGELSVESRRFEVVSGGSLQLRLPAENGLATVRLQLEDETGQIRCRNYINIEVRAAPAARVEPWSNGWALRFNPAAIGKTSWPRPTLEPNGAKFAALGSGWVDYELALPNEVDLSRLNKLHIRFEASARAGMAKVDWPQQTHGLNYPQTEAKSYPTDLTVLVNQVQLDTTRLEDDPADARGVLSHHREYDPGSYGYLTEISLTDDLLESVQPALAANRILQLRFAILPEAKRCGGLALYGETLGRYPLDPTVFLEIS